MRERILKDPQVKDVRRCVIMTLRDLLSPVLGALASSQRPRLVPGSKGLAKCRIDLNSNNSFRLERQEENRSI